MFTTEAQIEGFISEYKRSRVVAETSVRAILKRAVEWERRLHKAFYDYNKEEALEGIKSGAGYMRKELGRRVQIRIVPELQFVLDDSIEYKADNI